MLTKKDIQLYQKLKIELSSISKNIGKVCKQYFEKKLKVGDWQEFSGWNLCNDMLVISYSYTDYHYNTDAYTEYADIKVDLNDFIEFSKTM